MAPETSDQQPQNQNQNQNNVTPASNQNLIVGIVMGAVVLLLLLLVISQHFNKGGETQESPEVAELRKQISEKEARSEAMRYSGINGISQNHEALIAQIKSDTDHLGRLFNSHAGDAALLRTTQDSAAAMGRQITDLKAQLGQYQVAASRVAGLENDLTNAQHALSGAIDKASADSLREQLSLARLERDRLKEQLANQGNMIDSNTHALLMAELQDLKTSNAALRAENQRLLADSAGSKLFVTKDDLSPRAVALYRELKRIEAEGFRARPQTYTRIDSQLGASVGASITFKTGKADIARKHEAHLKNMALASPQNTFFLVVGYASPSGDSMSNQELSSQRATRVASMVNYLKKQGQAVQAVYLGEGNRFGPSDGPNQVCEVWEIRP